MKRRKKIMIIILIPLLILLLQGCNKAAWQKGKRQYESLDPIKVAVLLYRFDDRYINQVKESLQGIQGENKDKVEFSFYDSKGDQSIEDKNLDDITKKGTDLIIINLVDIEVSKKIIDKIKETNIPVILFNREPITLDSVKSYNKSIYIGTNAEEAGIMQGNIIVNLWNNNKESVDKNHDGKLNYVMLTGDRDNKEAIGRTKYSVLTIQKAGIDVEELDYRVANWDRLLAKRAIESVLFKHGNKIEAIIANNDAMAEGAIEALQSMGYNKGDPSKTIIVVGVDATTEAQNLITKGYMTGTVLQNDYELAQALYLVGMNLALGKKPLEDTKYKFDGSGVAIRLPYEVYTTK